MSNLASTLTMTANSTDPSLSVLESSTVSLVVICIPVILVMALYEMLRTDRMMHRHNVFAQLAAIGHVKGGGEEGEEEEEEEEGDEDGDVEQGPLEEHGGVRCYGSMA
ncbi:hypothetical protein K504DRAFT_498030 [Pleomassaria siparia CBS 279.74]|uniref:Uncharacterized protein n=1 Tax=Pleomassaria siparia CBS 279.74 TaxID=1314801 RepID=A0A6G1KK54_9PLEO|nr:hypothetical protein K504DRAFT_498030 [Pleomassaria siparia CBS 279.74]